MNKPSGWDGWSKRDRQDYEYLRNACDISVIPASTLIKMSERVLQAAMSETVRLLCKDAEDAEMEDLIKPSMKDKIQALLNMVENDLPDGCRGLRCDDCPLHTHHDGVRSKLCEALLKHMSKTDGLPHDN